MQKYNAGSVAANPGYLSLTLSFDDADGISPAQLTHTALSEYRDGLIEQLGSEHTHPNYVLALQAEIRVIQSVISMMSDSCFDVLAGNGI